MVKAGTDVLRFGADEYARLLFAEATDGVFFADAEGCYVAVNRSGHRLLGYDDGELVGRCIGDVVLESELPRVRAALSAAARGEVQSRVWSMLRKDGSVVALEVLAQRLSNGAILAIVRDLYARGDIERKIRTSEARLWSILHTAPDVILTVDRRGQILFINRTQPPLTVEQVIGSNCFDYVTTEERPRVEQAIEHVFNTRGFDEYEIRSPPNASGERGWSAVRAGPLIEGDRVVAATLCATDVTEHKRANARTHELLERLRKIASMVPGVVYQFQMRPDGSTSFPYVSERVRELFRVTPEALLDDATPIFDLIHPEDSAAALASLARSARTLEPWTHEFRVVFRGDDVHWVYGNSVPERQPDGSTLWHGFITEVTAEKQADLARTKLEAQLQESQKMESVGQLAGGVAHDFNNMLTSIAAFVELSQDELPANSPARQHLDGILVAAKRGAELTQHLLAFARKKIVQPENVDLNGILNRMAPMIGRLVGEHIRVELALAPKLSRVKVDVGSVEQVIMNLIVNARDAMPDGGKLTLETQDVMLEDGHTPTHPDVAPGAYTLLVVTDTGFGIGPEICPRVFEPFFTTKAPGVGTGLGLAMCHGIVKQAGGAITVHSEPGNGSSFSIYLPSRMHAPSDAPGPARPATAIAGHETVLLVEDEPLILRVARTALERLGYHVLCAGDGIEALELVGAQLDAIDLLVTDVVMPRLGGRELARRLQSLRPSIKVLYTSGYAENAIATDGVLREGVNFIQKPYALATLAKRVREVLDQA